MARAAVRGRLACTTIRAVPPAPPRRPRAEPREIAELRALADRQPGLRAAALLEVDLLDTQRRVQGRVSTPWIDFPDEEMIARLRAGRRLLDFDRLHVEWTDVRLLFRQVTDILHRHEALDAAATAALHALERARDLPQIVRRWYDAGSDPDGGEVDSGGAPREGAGPEMLDEVIAWSMRPFLIRAADVLIQRVPADAWRRGDCPVCGGEPNLAVLTGDGARVLCCGRCLARWPDDPHVCPYCGESDASHRTSFAARDGLYRLLVCLTCRRYLKALDSRRAGRPVLPAYDSIATLPLDAAAMQQGFSAG